MNRLPRPLAYRRPRLRLVLANAHTILRRGVRMLLAEEPDIEIIGEASSVSDAIALVRCLQPDVIINDVFEDRAGIAAIHDMHRECATARIVMLTHSTDKECERAALIAGARAYIVNDAPIEVLLRAIREESADSDAPSVDAALQSMTPREREVLVGVARGYSSKRIAGDLERSVKTIEKHRFKMMHKLGLRNTAAVTRYAIDNGLLDDDSRSENKPAGARHREIKAQQE
jgi:two-component system, NarL family, nitrate/nitrite response regulator NarL